MSESQVTISVDPGSAAYTVTVAGRVDSSNANELDETLSQLIEDKITKLVLELTGVTYMSSAGLRAIVSALRASKKKRGDVRIAAPSERVAEVFALAGLNPLFETYDDVETAVNSFE
ncbi:MAG: anti-anti-sigma factor [Chloroflexi bacterium]|nr:MAG: anti-anti-sigma factor [Chloroflexota bacterium]PIE82195.1 MAG: anti-anti-sigma factor [Chloroflexota bacterium]